MQKVLYVEMNESYAKTNKQTNNHNIWYENTCKKKMNRVKNYN